MKLEEIDLKALREKRAVDVRRLELRGQIHRFKKLIHAARLVNCDYVTVKASHLEGLMNRLKLELKDFISK